MKHLKQITYLFTAILAVLTGSLLTSCSASEPENSGKTEELGTTIPTEYPQVMKLLLSIDLPAATRGESFEEGTPGESALDTENFDLKVFFFRAGDSKTFITSAGNATFSPKGESEGKMLYELVTTPIIGLPQNGEFRVVVLANLRHEYPDPVPGMTTLDQFYTSSKTLLYRPKAGFPGLGEGEFPMPFFGLKELKVNYDETGAFDAGTISLLRSLVKITVSQRENSVYTLMGVTLKNGNNQLYVSPREVYKESDYASPNASNPTLADNWNSKLNIPTQTAYDITLAKDDDGIFYVYVPEATVKGIEDGKKPYLQLYFNEGVEDRLDFKDYTKGSTKIYDLHRNWHFSFSITKSGPMDITLDVVPYCLIKLNPDFGIGDYDDPFKDDNDDTEDTDE